MNDVASNVCQALPAFLGSVGWGDGRPSRSRGCAWSTGRVGSCCRKGLMDGACHVIGCHSNQETTVQNAFDDVASTNGLTDSARHVMGCH
jgi:hypothetical protein